MAIVLIFIICVHCLLNFSEGSSASEAFVLKRRGFISFEDADITISLKTPNGEKIAEAFNATTGVKDPRKMQWVSLGIPRLLIRKEGINSSKVILYLIEE